MRVFIIEDNDYKYKALKNSLLKYDETIEVVREIARNKAAYMIHTYRRGGNKIDLFITDNYLPIFENDRELKPSAQFIINRIKNEYPNTPVCVCSGEPMDIECDYFIQYDSSVSTDEPINEMMTDLSLNKPKVLTRKKNPNGKNI